MRTRIRSLGVACLLLLFTFMFVACGAPATTNAPATSTQVAGAPEPVLVDLHGPDELKAQFNRDAGVPRLILLVSPT